MPGRVADARVRIDVSKRAVEIPQEPLHSDTVALLHDGPLWRIRPEHRTDRGRTRGGARRQRESVRGSCAAADAGCGYGEHERCRGLTHVITNVTHVLTHVSDVLTAVSVVLTTVTHVLTVVIDALTTVTHVSEV